MTLIEKELKVMEYCRKFEDCPECPCYLMPCNMTCITEEEVDALLATFENWEVHSESGSVMKVDDLSTGKTTEISGEKEAVNHPDHYQGPHECIEVMEAMFGKEAVKNFCRCNAFKYRFRAGMKNGEEDIKKAEWYEEYLIKMGGIDNGMQEVR